MATLSKHATETTDYMSGYMLYSYGAAKAAVQLPFLWICTL